MANEAVSALAREEEKVPQLSVSAAHLNTSRQAKDAHFKMSKNGGDALATVCQEVDETTDDFGHQEPRPGRKMQLLPYDEALKLVRSLGLPSTTAYKAIMRQAFLLAPHSPLAHLPYSPAVSYRGQFSGWRDYLGPSFIGKDGLSCLGYQQAKSELSQLGLSSPEDYRAYLLRSGRRDLPRHPQKTYRKEQHARSWGGWDDFLGVLRCKEEGETEGPGQRGFPLPYELAKKALENFHLTSSSDFFTKKDAGLLPAGLPARPDMTYKSKIYGNIWQKNGGWKGFLGASYDEAHSFKKSLPLSYEEAKALVAPYGFKKSGDYGVARRAGLLPDRLPVSVSSYFRKRGQWQGWSDFLSLSPEEKPHLVSETTEAAPLLSFDKARQLLLPLGVKNKSHYRKMAELGLLPAGLPLRPELTYRRADCGARWISWPHFLFSRGRED